MKLKIFLSMLVMLFALPASAQLINGKYLPEPTKMQNDTIKKYGYCIYEEVPGEGKRFRLILNYQFDDAFPFNKKVFLARVRVGDKYGFISTTGGYLVKPIFDAADNFSDNGLCRVVLDKKYGLLDKDGTMVVPAVYDSMDDLFNGWYEVSRDGRWGYVHWTNRYASSASEYQKLRDSGLGEPK